MKTPVLGLDFGWTLANLDNVENVLEKFELLTPTELIAIPEYEGCLRAVSELATCFQSVYVISACTKPMEANVRLWLDMKGYVGGNAPLHSNRIHFCLERSGKAPLCEVLGITHFVDDRFDVLGHLHSVPYRFQFGRRDENHFVPNVPILDNWKELGAAIKATLL